MSQTRKTIAIDFDGVIHAYSEGWKDGALYDGPHEGAFDGIFVLLQHFNVFILSTRHPANIFTWLAEKQAPFEFVVIEPEMLSAPFWNVPNVVGITNRKLGAEVYIDDRAIHFATGKEGEWDRITTDLLWGPPIKEQATPRIIHDDEHGMIVQM